MLPFFFIPATKFDKIKSVQKTGVVNIIIDFEDAILEKDRKRLVERIRSAPTYKEFWFRIPVRNDFSQEEKDLELLKLFLELGVRKIILPKIVSKEDYEEVNKYFEVFNDIKIILLIEHPRLLMEMHQILQVSIIENKIFGIGLGSHDLVTFMDIEHTLENIYFPRVQTLYLCKAYKKIAIDIASMNLSDEGIFKNEVLAGQEAGFDAKFIIHPKQLLWLEKYSGYPEDQIKWAKNIISALPASFKGKDVEPFILNGQVIEKPHVEKALEILRNNKYE